MLIDQDNPLGAEIQREMAEAYFAACRKMVDALEALGAFDRSCSSLQLNPEQHARRKGLVEDAGERVYFVMIQREAMQLACFESFFEGYEIPEEVRQHLGPKRPTKHSL